MFELHLFFPLFEPAWSANPEKTAEVLVGLIDHAKKLNMDVTVCILENALAQLAGGGTLAVVGEKAEAPKWTPTLPSAPLPPTAPQPPGVPALPALPPAPPPVPSIPQAPTSPRGRRQRRA